MAIKYLPKIKTLLYNNFVSIWQFTSLVKGRCWFKPGSDNGFESHHGIIMLSLLILTQAEQRMASREEEKPMGNVIHQLKVFTLTLLEFTLAGLVNITCGLAMPPTLT